MKHLRIFGFAAAALVFSGCSLFQTNLAPALPTEAPIVETAIAEEMPVISSNEEQIVENLPSGNGAILDPEPDPTLEALIVDTEIEPVIETQPGLELETGQDISTEFGNSGNDFDSVNLITDDVIGEDLSSENDDGSDGTGRDGGADDSNEGISGESDSESNDTFVVPISDPLDKTVDEGTYVFAGLGTGLVLLGLLASRIQYKKKNRS